jgi:hypothetical protein
MVSPDDVEVMSGSTSAKHDLTPTSCDVLTRADAETIEQYWSKMPISGLSTLS